VTDVLLVTCADLPDGEDGGALLVDRCADRDVTARWVVWDDPSVAWADAALVAVRSPWDYDRRRDEFLGWARAVEAATPMLNGADVFEWNTDKAYLARLGDDGLPVVPTIPVAGPSGLAAAAATFPEAVVKPRVGAGGRGVRVVRGGEVAGLDTGDGPWVVQPLVGSVRDEGETSVFVLGGRVVSQILKIPGAGEIRVHEEYGGRSVPVPVSDEAAGLASLAVRTAERLLGRTLPYARVDLMRLDDGRLAVSELEVTEPGLYLDLVPENADAFADLLAEVLEGRRG
jgi:glutathione synthase/RimK-type ligase-like ATP-grasp enzyme